MDGKGGYMAEGHMHGSVKLLRKNLMWMMNEMSRIRDAEFGEFQFGTEVLGAPVNRYRCCVAAPVFMEH